MSTAQINAKRITKIFKGDTNVWDDDSVWIPLKLGDGVTGAVLFKDNGNGTASLVGSMQVKDQTARTVLYPPVGYQFTATHWDLSLVSVVGTGNYGGTNETITSSISNGNLNMIGDPSWGNNAYYGVTFQAGMLLKSADKLSGSDPALIDIKII